MREKKKCAFVAASGMVRWSLRKAEEEGRAIITRTEKKKIELKKKLKDKEETELGLLLH
jgi:hypothetical protein